jgi:hypothetical protein
MFTLSEDVSVSVKESEALLENALPPAPMSVRVIESDADMNPLNTLVTESVSVIESVATPEKNCPAVLLNGAAENGEKPNIV